MKQVTWCVIASFVIAVARLGSASAAPPRPTNDDPPTYDCEPGTPNPRTKSCNCPSDHDAHVHESKVPFCKKRIPTDPPSGISCGALAPRLGVRCARACNDERREAAPSPWDTGAPAWLRLNKPVVAERTCRHGPSSSAAIQASCTSDASHLSLAVKADAQRDGECAACVGSEAHTAFEWRTVLPKQHGAAVFAKTRGDGAAQRCTLRLGTDQRSWADAMAGAAKALEDGDVEVHVTCTEPSTGFASVACAATKVSESLALDLEIGQLPPPSIMASGPPGPAGFSHGMQTTSYCGNNPESWARGSATLDTRAGTLSVQVQLETDSVAAGPKARLVIRILDAHGQVLVTIDSSELGMGGKPPGKAVTRNWSSQVQLPDYIAKRAASAAIAAQCTGAATQLFGIGGDPTHAFSLAVH